MFLKFAGWIRQARESDGLHFSSILPEQTITECFSATSRIQRSDTVYTLPVMVWMFLNQVLSADHSCRETVARLNAWRISRGKSPVSADTGRYCTVRDKLDGAGCQRLVERTARQIDAQAPESWRWQGRQVFVVDGTTVTMPDTPKNQVEYPQQCNQNPGCGQPIMRLVAMFSLATGVVLRLAMGPCRGKQTAENSSFRDQMADELNHGDVLLADRFFSGWFDIALLHARGVEVVVRKNQVRHSDFRRGRRLGSGDHLIRWFKPKRPEWMDQATYDSLPQFLTIREVRVIVRQKGFRSREVIVATTLWNHNDFPASAIADLYRRRWDAEINLRSLKTHMQMEHLRCKTPHRVRNEIWMHALAYNLIRGTMASAAIEANLKPWQISFKGTVQTLNQYLPISLTATDIPTWIRQLFKAIAKHVVGNRPNRVEPRVRKRRPKPYPLMQKPRNELRKRLPLKGI